MSEKRFSLEYYDNMSYVKDNFNDNEYYLYWAVELMNKLYEENEQLKEKNEKLQWELDKAREDLKYFANPKITAIRGSDCGHERCYVTSMQKKR